MAARWSTSLAMAAALLGASPAIVGALKTSLGNDPTKASGEFKMNDDKPRRCRKPEIDEKVVYFVTPGETDDGDNTKLTDIGTQQARELQRDPLLSQALSKNAMYRAQAVIVAPWKRTLQTAMLAFGDELPKAAWEVDHDVKGVDGAGGTDAKEAEVLLQNYKASANLMRRYQAQYESTASAELTAEQRFKRFTNNLRSRNETNIIVVGTPFEARMAGVELSEGEVEVFALLKDEAEASKQGKDYRALSKPSLWVHCNQINEAPFEAGFKMYLDSITNFDKRQQYEAFMASHERIPDDIIKNWGK